MPHCGTTVKTAHWRPRGSRFKSQPTHHLITTFDKLFIATWQCKNNTILNLILCTKAAKHNPSNMSVLPGLENNTRLDGPSRYM